MGRLPAPQWKENMKKKSRSQKRLLAQNWYCNQALLGSLRMKELILESSGLEIESNKIMYDAVWNLAQRLVNENYDMVEEEYPIPDTDEDEVEYFGTRDTEC